MLASNKDGSTYTALDAEHVQRSRLRVEARKWLLSKALPKVYGDKLDLNTTITQTHEQSLDVLDRVAREMKKEGAQQRALLAVLNGRAQPSHRRLSPRDLKRRPDYAKHVTV
jgi:Bacteriophage Sf6, terminase small subunit-like